MAKVFVSTYDNETGLEDKTLYYEVTLEDLKDFYTDEEIAKFQSQENEGNDPDYIFDDDFLQYLEEKHEDLIKREGVYR